MQGKCGGVYCHFPNVSETSYPYLYGFGKQKSLAAYVKRHAYSNAKTEDLWTALEEGSGEPVNKLMSSWTKQKGYPVVSAKLKDGKLELEQVHKCFLDVLLIPLLLPLRN